MCVRDLCVCLPEGVILCEHPLPRTWKTWFTGKEYADTPCPSPPPPHRAQMQMSTRPSQEKQTKATEIAQAVRGECLVKVLVLQARRPEFKPRSPRKGGKRELPTPSNCPLTSTHTPRRAHMCTHTLILIISKNVKRRQASVFCFPRHPYRMIYESCGSRFKQCRFLLLSR